MSTTTHTRPVHAGRHDTIATVIPMRGFAGRHVAPAKRAYVRVPEDTRDRVVARLLALETAQGKLRKRDYAEEADRCGASASSVEKWVRQARTARTAGRPATPDPRGTRTSAITITDEILLTLSGRSVMAGYLECVARGLVSGHYTTFRTALVNQVAPDVLAGIRRGEKALPEHWVYLERSGNTLMDMVTIDLFFPRVYCVDDDSGEVVHPVWAAVRERASGTLLCWHLFRGRVEGDELDAEGEPRVRADAAGILAMLGEAFRGWVRDGVFVGGIPNRLRCDREALFLTPDNRAALMGLGIAVDPTNSYSSWENGAHERMHQVIRREALDGLPSSTRGPRTRSGALVHAGASIGFRELEARLDRWALSYVFERVNSAVGMTPFEYWCERMEAGDHLDRAAPASLAELALAGSKVLVRGKHGLSDGAESSFSASALMDHPRRTFTLARWLNDDSTREAFDATTGEWVATVYRRSNTPVAEEAKVLARRSQSRRTVAALEVEAKRRYAIATGPDPVLPTPAVPGDDTEDPTLSPSEVDVDEVADVEEKQHEEQVEHEQHVDEVDEELDAPVPIEANPVTTNTAPPASPTADGEPAGPLARFRALTTPTRDES